MSLPGQVFAEEDYNGHSNGKSLNSDNDTITTRTSGYTSGIVQDSDADSLRHFKELKKQQAFDKDLIQGFRPPSKQSTSSSDN